MKIFGYPVVEVDDITTCCGGSGWHVWRPLILEGERAFVWVACADCNDDGAKPKPELCETCGAPACDRHSGVSVA